jgi:hypothetical protein
MTGIARNACVGWSAFTAVGEHLLDKDTVVQMRTVGNAKMFKLNTENPIVKKLIKLDKDIKLETEKLHKK